jgi:hypothetical protein
MKISESNLRKIIRHEAKSMLHDKRSLNEREVFSDEKYKRIVEIIRAELARVFHTFYRKRNFWT